MQVLQEVFANIGCVKTEKNKVPTLHRDSENQSSMKFRTLKSNRDDGALNKRR